MGLKPRKPRPLSKVKAAIEKEMASVERKSSFPSSSSLVVNKDGTIDAEIRIRIPRGKSAQDVFTDLASSMKPVSGTWVSSGVIFPPRDESEQYEKLEGMSIARTYAQRNTPTKMQLNLQGGEAIADRVRSKGRRKPAHAIVRIHWNKKDKQPDQPGQRKKQKKYREDK